MNHITLALTLLLSSLFAPIQASNCRKHMRYLSNQRSAFHSTNVYEYRRFLGSLERINNFLRNIKESQNPAINIQIYKKFDDLNAALFAGNLAGSKRDWRTFFREYEINLISFKRLHRLLDLLKESEDVTPENFLGKMNEWGYPELYSQFIAEQLKELKTITNLKHALEVEHAKNVVMIANHYQEYTLIRKHLEEIHLKPNCDENCAKLAKMLLDDLGAKSSKEKIFFPVFFHGETRPSLESLKDLLYDIPLFVEVKLKRERNAEFVALVKDIFSLPEVVDTVFGFLYKSTPIGKARATKLFKMVYNAQARNVHFPKIDNVLYGPKDPKKAMASLETENATIPNDELLITFARRVDPMAKQTWSGIKQVAEETDKGLFERMVKAETEAEKRGDISPSQGRSVIGKIATLIVVGVPAIGYFYFDALPVTVQEFLSSSDEGEALEGTEDPTKVQSEEEEEDSIEAPQEKTSPPEASAQETEEVLINPGDEADLTIEEAAELLKFILENEGLLRILDKYKDQSEDGSQESNETERNPSSLKETPALFTRIWNFFF